MRVGISLLTHEGHNLWNNGIGQNVYHLACLLEAIPFIEQVVLLNCGDQPQPPANSGDAGRRFALLSLAEAGDAINVAIELSGGLDVEWLARFRARGGKVAFHNCGQPYFALVEPPIFGQPGFFSQAERCDEVWLLPKDRPFTAMMRALHRCPVFEVPYLWSPLFLKEIAAAVGPGESFGYRAGTLSAQPGRPAIFEANVSAGKMGIIPFMICEEIERARPEALAHVHFLNAQRMIEQITFVALIENSNLYHAGKLSLAPRDYFPHVMARGANIVVSHQLDVPQNYLYLDALAGHYPLIHNSPLFSDVGYFYAGSDVRSGAARLLEAMREHDRNLDDYAARCQRKIASFDPLNRANIDAYARRLLALACSGDRRRSA